MSIKFINLIKKKQIRGPVLRMGQAIVMRGHFCITGHFWAFARVFGMFILMCQFENDAVASINERL